MSTFNGLVSEFPDIRIDFFRQHQGRMPPLACFLSHVHSDHLAGLDTLRSPFVYCSSATREILLRLEKYACRINYVQGILEARQQSYKHLRKILKALPLEAPTVVELRPDYKIQVTLFDANHCPGSTMFLIEGEGKAILYTGDVRAEPWFVNSVARNPLLIEYTHGLKTLDKLYLDTSFIEDVAFQTKSEGTADLLKKVRMYPPSTIFHFQAWTFGYEEVWIALSKALNSQIHVDDYKIGIFRSLKGRHAGDSFSSDYHLTHVAAALSGHTNGNNQHPGCLTSNQHVRLHSCEKGNMCSVAKSSDVVSIIPVVCRLPEGEVMVETGVGGGGRDFSREAVLDLIANSDLRELLESTPNFNSMDSRLKEEITIALKYKATSGRGLPLEMTIDDFEDDLSTSLTKALQFLCCKLRQGFSQPTNEGERERDDGLPKKIFFPYARHSPYRELCSLASLFNPRDIWPCTVDKRWKVAGASVQSLFGEFCSAQIFKHDQEMAAYIEQEPNRFEDDTSTRSPSDSTSTLRSFTPIIVIDHAPGMHTHNLQSPFVNQDSLNCRPLIPTTNEVFACMSKKRPCSNTTDGIFSFKNDCEHGSREKKKSIESSSSPIRTLTRYEAYQTMLANSEGNEAWVPISLLSTDGNHGNADAEL